MFRNSITSALLLATIAITGACAKNQTANAEHQTMGPGMMGMGDHCPLDVPGTTVQEADTPDGTAMTFTTTGDVAELRTRVRAMATRMEAQSSGGMGMHGMMMGGADSGSGMTMGGGMAPGMSGMKGGADGGSGMMMGQAMPPMHAQVDDVEGGARLRMIPVDPSGIGEMKRRMHQHAQMMNQAHGCPMMGPAL